MGFRDADRAQAVQVGAILLFGILIIGLSMYQATVVPQQNERVEFNAYQEATTDMVSVRDDIVTAGTRGTTASTTVRTGTTYPARTIFVNPGTPAGTLTTTSAEPVDLDGVQAVETEPENVQQFWNTSSGQYPTSGLAFRPSYNEFDAPPVAITGRSVYRLPGSRVLPVSAESLVSGNRITLVTLRGEFSTAGLSTPVTAEPVSTATRTVVITGSGSTFNITIPTPGDATAWNDSMGADVVSNPNVLGTTPHPNQTVTITFDGDRQYELRLAAVELRGQSDASDVPRPDPAYIVGVTPNGTAATEQATPVTVEVRDRYDNPVSGTDVTLSLVEGQGQFVRGGTSRTVATDGEGRATVALRPATNYFGNLTVRAQGDFDGSGSVESVERTHVGLAVPSDLSAVNAPGGGVALGTSAVGGSGQNADLVELTLNNTADEERVITDVRVPFYFLSGTGTGGGNEPTPTEWQFANPSRSAVYTIGDLQAPVSPPITLPADQETTITFDFNNPDPDAQNDFFILTLQFENAGHGTYYIYVNP